MDELEGEDRKTGRHDQQDRRGCQRNAESGGERPRAPVERAEVFEHHERADIDGDGERD